MRAIWCSIILPALKNPMTFQRNDILRQIPPVLVSSLQGIKFGNINRVERAGNRRRQIPEITFA